MQVRVRCYEITHVDYLFGAGWRAVLMPTTPLAGVLVRGTFCLQRECEKWPHRITHA